MKKQIFTLFTMFLGALLVNAQTVTTFSAGSPDDDIDLDSQGNIYASGFVAGSVFKFTPSGDMTVFISGLGNANGLAFDSNDNLYVNDWQLNLIKRYDINGVFDDEIFIPGNPSGIIPAFGNPDDMIYTRYSGNTINRITPDGTITEVSSDPALDGPVGLAYDELGNLYVANYNTREIFRVNPGGDLQYVATVGNQSVLGFIAYAQGMLWGTVLGEHKIYRINPLSTNDVTLYAGSTVGSNDGDLSTATFNQPNGIAFSEDEQTMYITDFGTKNLRIISGVTLGGTEALSQDKLRLFPNPVETSLTLSVHPSIIANGDNILKVYNTLGQVVFEETTLSEEMTLDVSNWSHGHYILEVRTDRGNLRKQFIK